LSEKINFRNSGNKVRKISSVSNNSSDSETSKYNNLPEALKQFIMIEFSNGFYNVNWLKFYFENLDFRELAKKEFLKHTKNEREKN